MERTIEQAKRETRELNKNFVVQLWTALEKRFARTDAKFKGKVEKIIQVLDIIISQK